MKLLLLMMAMVTTMMMMMMVLKTNTLFNNSSYETKLKRHSAIRQCLNFQLKMITDRMVKSLENDVSGFLRDIDRSLEASRNIFRQFEQTAKPVPESIWQEIQQRVDLITL